MKLTTRPGAQTSASRAEDAPGGGGAPDLARGVSPETAKKMLDYQYCYCEENTLRLLQDSRLPHSRRFAVGITGDGDYFALGRAAGADNGVANWDYHVVTVAFDDVAGRFVVFDFDSELPFPTPLEDYVRESFTALDCPRDLEARFRVFPADTYLSEFSSDRSHMRDQSGNWLAEPPPWPATLNPEGRITIAALNDARAGDVPGTLVRSPAALLEHFRREAEKPTVADFADQLSDRFQRG